MLYTRPVRVRVPSSCNTVISHVKPGSGLPYEMDGGARGKFWKEPPRRYQDPVLWGRLEFFFSPLRGTNSSITHYFLSYLFRRNTLKGTAVDLLRLNTQMRYQNRFFKLFLFIWEFLPGRKHAFQTCNSTLQHDGLQENAAWITWSYC